MVKHIVFFKLQNGTDELKNEVKNQLLSLKQKISYLVHVEVGLTFSNEQRAYDIALITEFATRDDLQKYAIDPLHVEVINFIKSINATTKVVDYEC